VRAVAGQVTGCGGNGSEVTRCTKGRELKE
jgi:hypothetical protein